MCAKITHLQQFILIDHSLTNLGGHHYPYALSVLQAAERAGLAPVLATHEHFRQRTAFSAQWPVHPLFGRASYSRHTLDKQSMLRKHLQCGPVAGVWQRLKRLHANWMRARIQRSFADGCSRLFARVQLRPGDQVFIGTASELDLAGLAHFLRRQTTAAGVHWHLQFHFGIFDGRDPDYPQQIAAADAMRNALRAAMRGIEHCQLSFYCTTDALTRQYRLLGVGEFNTLPYPVHELFSRPLPLRPTPLPARIACLGHSRREKGYSELPRLLAQLRDHLADGRARLVLQTRHTQDRQRLAAAAHLDESAIALAPAGLGLQQYAELVRSSDVGLLLYNGERYYDRCSGVLLEMLVAGVPVVVPAASWLSEQIVAVNQLYLAGLENTPGIITRILPTVVATGSASTLVVESGGAENLLLRFRWRSPRQPGHFLRLAAGQSIRILGPVPDQDIVRVLLRVPAGSASIGLSWSNAFATAPIELDQVVASEIPGPALPLGAVGLAMADSSQAAECLRDILDHLAHYKQQTAVFATQCAQHHSADGVVAQLIGANSCTRASG